MRRSTPSRPPSPRPRPRSPTPGARPREHPREHPHRDNYEITGLLGRGGLPTVYRARHLVSGTTCALKVTRSEPKALEALHAVHQALRQPPPTSSPTRSSPCACKSGEYPVTSSAPGSPPPPRSATSPRAISRPSWTRCSPATSCTRPTAASSSAPRGRNRTAVEQYAVIRKFQRCLPPELVAHLVATRVFNAAGTAAFLAAHRVRPPPGSRLWTRATPHILVDAPAAARHGPCRRHRRQTPTGPPLQDPMTGAKGNESSGWRRARFFCAVWLWAGARAAQRGEYR